ncbi:MAG: hypothetical protein RIC52_16125 [Amphiplicatus sp.]
MLLSDYVVLALYLAGMLGIGVFYAFRNTNMSAMFTAGGQSPWWVAGLSSFMTMFSAGTFVVWGGIAYKYGLVAVFINFTYGIAAIIVGWTIAGKWAEMGIRTPAQYVEARFGKAALRVYISVMMFFRLTGSATSLYALSILFVALVPLPEDNFFRNPETGNLSVFWMSIIFGAVIVCYTMAGGLWAVLITDVVQFIVLNLAVLFLLPMMFGAAGGAGDIFEGAPAGFFSPVGGGYGWLFLIGWTAIHVFKIGADWAFAQRFISVTSPRDARRSAYLFGVLYLVSPLLWLAPPLMYRMIDPSAPPEQAYILGAQSVLPAGMLGLLMAAMFSATASKVSSEINVFAGALTEPFAQRIEKLGGAAIRAVWVGRVFTLLLGAFVISIAVAVPAMGGAEKVIVVATSFIVGPLVAPSVFGLFSRRIDANAVWITLGVAIALGVFFKIGLAPSGPFAEGAFKGLAAWAQANPRETDLVVGLVSPILVLTGMHFLSPATAKGALKIDAFRSEAARRVGKKPAGEAGAIVAGALAVSGVVMGVLAVLDTEGRTPLAIFAIVLLALAGAGASFHDRQVQRSRLREAAV